jgi:hypothetical protein
MDDYSGKAKGRDRRKKSDKNHETFAKNGKNTQRGLRIKLERMERTKENQK